VTKQNLFDQPNPTKVVCGQRKFMVKLTQPNFAGLLTPDEAWAFPQARKI